MRFSIAYMSKLIGGASLIALLILVPLCWFFYQAYLEKPLDITDEGLIFNVPENSNLYAVSSELALSGYLKYPRILVLHARWNEQTDIKAGEYHFEAGMTPVAILEQLNRGSVIQHPVTIIEGWRLSEILDALQANPQVDSHLTGKSNQEIAQLLELDVSSLEGWLYPDTYIFPRGTTDIEILKQAYSRMNEVLDEEWSDKDKDLPFDTPYEALILASLIEKETGVAHERSEIAGVFVRRLQKGMRLQTDPTVIYGLGSEFDGNLTRAHLLEETPYNTYRINGLPPTPIAAPGRDAIRAAVNPAEGNALYFVGRGDGAHQFSATLEEHNAAVRKYQIEQRAPDYRSSVNPASSGAPETAQ